jgi:maleylacetoacetate isomerase|tara:strand:+ start:1141 stop:1830 length:690 start_codon:yes stop_codon:yes gene_type:complete
MSSDTDLQLYSYYRSSAAYRVRITLEIKQLSYKILPINLLTSEHRQPKYLQTNLQGLVPTMSTPEGTLSQSLAIIEYLEERYPQPSLLPKTPIDRAQVRSIAHQVAMDIHPLNNPRVTQFLGATIGLNKGQRLHWYHHWIAQGFGALENNLKALNSNGQYCIGEMVTMADICLIPQVYNALRFDCPVQDYPLISAVYSHCSGLASFIAASPESQLDCPIKNPAKSGAKT